MAEPSSPGFATGYSVAFVLGLAAGIIWSFGAVVVKHLEQGNIYQLQYVVYRGLTFASLILLFMLLRYRSTTFTIFAEIGRLEFIGGALFAGAMISFIYAINLTSVAVVLFMFAITPFIAGVIGYYLLGERVSRTAALAMLIALIGTLIMILNDSIRGNALGALLGLVAATAIAGFTVSLRAKPRRERRNGSMLCSMVIGGLLSTGLCFGLLGFSLEKLAMPVINIQLSMLHGILVASGMILYNLSARHIPASELAFLALTEVIGGVLWAALPIFGINEVPDLVEITGALVMISAIVLYATDIRRREKEL